MLIIVFLFILATVIVGFYYINKVIINQPPFNYPSSENLQKKDSDKKTLICFGDSNTHATVSFDWVGLLRSKSPDLNVFNAGINADLTYTLLRRINEVIACKPDFITLLIGTNDVNATMGPERMARYRELERIKDNEHPTTESFEKNYREILQTLTDRTNANIGLITLPLLGEDLEHEANQKTGLYSKIIKKLANEFGLEVLDFRTKQEELLPPNRNVSQWPYEKFTIVMSCVVALHYMLGISWNTGSMLFGKTVTTDSIHLNKTSGVEMEKLVNSWLQKNGK